MRLPTGRGKFKIQKGLNMTKEEIAQTIAAVKERQRRGKLIRAKKAAEKAAKKADASSLRSEVMEAIQKLNKAQPQKINTGSDYEGLILAYQKKNNCSYLESVRGVEKLVPNISKIKERWLEEKNAERDAARGGPRPIEKAEGRTYPEWVSYLKLHHKMSALQAGRYIDKHHPGLRQGYINKSNE